MKSVNSATALQDSTRSGTDVRTGQRSVAEEEEVGGGQSRQPGQQRNRAQAEALLRQQAPTKIEDRAQPDHQQPHGDRTEKQPIESR